ncbi:MAG: hypothetical protein A2138_24700 [Deltaproteobacteria bacterium RBG_16_71_12]|nr:MAG: hypothetical protein A2138_24700 [Deltaproteobacteria bacterium RBG_16_71_12]
MDLRGADYLIGTYDGELREDGPGVATIALDEGGPDGGALEVFRWPSVVGHRFASPAVGDRVRLRVEPWFLGESEAVPYVELFSASGRLLVAQFDIGAGSGLLEVTERSAGPSCSWPTAEPQCCCTADADVLVTVHADTPVDLGRCSEAIVTVDSAPLYVGVEHAVRRTQSDCGDDGWLLDARALAVALAE